MKRLILAVCVLSKGRLLDPYCGSGSSFSSGLECGIKEMYGCDINPFVMLLSKVKFTYISQTYIYYFQKYIIIYLKK